MIIIALLLPGWVIPSIDTNQLRLQRYFPETGHTVSGEFLIKYEEAKDPIRLYGYPITDAYQDNSTGRIVQYFQRARLEFYPEASEEERVGITPLGDYLYQTGAGKTQPIPAGTSACQLFTKTKHQVCYEFLNFFNKFGGIKQFGYPISDLEIQNGRIYQYFQYVRMEWRPELPSGIRVALADLGSAYFEKSGEDISHLEPSKNNSFIPEHVLSLQVHAFVTKDNSKNNDKPFKYRTLHVLVLDQRHKLVPSAVIGFDIQQVNGKLKHYSMPLPTNAEGFTFMTFDSDLLPPNELVVISVQADYNGILGKTQTAFWNWY